MMQFSEVGILVKEKISGNVVEVRRKSNRVTAIALTLGREVMRITCAYGLQSGKSIAEKVRFYDEMGSESDLSLFLWGISMDMCGNVLRVLKVYTGGIVLGKEIHKDCWSSVMKESCAWHALGLIRQKKMI